MSLPGQSVPYPEHRQCAIPRRPGLALACAAALALLLPVTVGAAPADPAIPSDRPLPPPATYRVYVGGQPDGTVKISFSRTTFESAPVIAQELVTTQTLRAGGDVEHTTRLETYVTPEGRPVLKRLETHDGRAERRVEARFFADHVECVSEINGQRSAETKKVPVPAGEVLAGSDHLRLLQTGLHVGADETVCLFDQSALAFKRGRLRVLGQERTYAGGQSIDAYIVVEDGDEKDWFSADGRLLKVESDSLKLRILREDLEQPHVSAAPPPDIMDEAAVPVDRMIADPRHTYLLTLKVTGISESALVLADGRQHPATNHAASVVAVYDVRAAFPPAHGAPVITKPGNDPMLQDDPYLQINDPAIRKQAQELAGSETDRAVVARRIRDWVAGRITKRVNMGVGRTAKEIMEHQDGVCREFATLFAAVARAVGIPTRICGGFEYLNGEFRWHAWNECRLTDRPDGWYPFDATLPDDFVDATHVKFTQGSLDEALRLEGVVHHVGVEVLDYR